MARNPIDFDGYWGRRENREWAIATVLKRAPSMDRDEAEDVVQDTLIRLWWGGHDRFDPNRHPLPLPNAYRDWVKRMLHGAVANRIKRRRTRAQLQRAWSAGQGGSGTSATRPGWV